MATRTKKAPLDLTEQTKAFAKFTPGMPGVSVDTEITSIHHVGAWRAFIVGTHPAPTMAQLFEVASHNEKEALHMCERSRSQDESDTDGFLSQWANQISANKESIAARIASQGGTDLHLGLYRASNGERIRAKMIETRFGPCWALCDEYGKFTGKFLRDTRTSGGMLAKLGLVVCGEWAPSKATVRGVGTGLSGQAWASCYRTDLGFPSSAVPL